MKGEWHDYPLGPGIQQDLGQRGPARLPLTRQHWPVALALQ